MSRKSGSRFCEKGHAQKPRAGWLFFELSSRFRTARLAPEWLIGAHAQPALRRWRYRRDCCCAAAASGCSLSRTRDHTHGAVCAGGSTDIRARVVSDHLARALRQPVVVENRTGASGNIGTAAVARSVPDGYAFLFNTLSVHTMNHALFAAMPFDGVRDFSAITLLAYVTNTMVVHPSIPASDVQGFIDYARANPGRIAYASAGAGSTNHLCGALFEKMAQVAMVHVPYRGGAPAVADTVA